MIFRIMSRSWIGMRNFIEDIKAGRIVSAYAVDGHGLAEAVSKMAFGNQLGVKIEHNVDPRDLFARRLGRYRRGGSGRQGRQSLSHLLYGNR